MKRMQAAKDGVEDGVDDSVARDIVRGCTSIDYGRISANTSSELGWLVFADIDRRYSRRIGINLTRDAAFRLVLQAAAKTVAELAEMPEVDGEEVDVT